MDSVLVVDDEPDVRDILGNLLSAEGYAIHLAADAEEALGVLASVPVAVAVCDKFMPGRDGLWLVAQIRKLRPEVAIILATADDSVLPTFTLQPGVIGYFVKPLNLDRVAKAVREAIAWHHSTRRCRR
jgi:DNA-binding NtrC family response regulator